MLYVHLQYYTMQFNWSVGFMETLQVLVKVKKRTAEKVHVSSLVSSWCARLSSCEPEDLLGKSLRNNFDREKKWHAAVFREEKHERVT